MKLHVLLVLVIFTVCSVLTQGPAGTAAAAEVTVDTWNSPVKAVLESNRVELQDLEVENGDYYIMYVAFPFDLSLEQESYFVNLTRAVAKAHQYRSFQLFDTWRDIKIEVSCKNGAVSGTVYNGEADYFGRLKALREKEKQLAAYLLQKVPELGDLEQMVKKASNGKASMVITIDTEPDPRTTDPYQRDYYVMNIDSRLGDELENLDQFLVHRDTQAIVWYDVDNEKYVTLAEWRKIYAAAPYWPDLFK